jgi:hypothetical protein
MKVAGIDVHKKVLMAVVLDASAPEGKPARRRFATLPSEGVYTENSPRPGQVEAGPLLLNIGRSQIYGDVRRRDVISAVLRRSAHTVAALSHGCVGQADGVEVILVALSAGNVNFNLNDAGILHTAALRVL